MPDLEYIFHPKSIAIVGASPNPSSIVNYFFLDTLIQFGYEGKLYPIHPTASKIAGLKVYPSITDVPGPVDHVICGINAKLTPNLTRECVVKGVKVLQFYTSGFSETGEEEGIRLQKEIAEIARTSGMRILGPNCMGIYCPSSKISYEASLSKESGNVGFFSQSGGNAVEGAQLADARGIYFSKIVSFGNASDINESDLLEYLTHDPQTTIIVGYIEGTKDGKRFASVLREAARTKPIIIVKGGLSEPGTAAVASHTGSLAGNNIVWGSLFDQLGIIQVYNFEEMVDLLLLFQHLEPPGGRRAGLVVAGGGNSILATDNCEMEGLSVPPFPQTIQRNLQEFFPRKPSPGTIVRNPVDPSDLGWDPGIFSNVLKTLDNYDGVDLILAYARTTVNIDQMNIVIDSLIETKKHLDKPIALIAHHSEEPKSVSDAYEIQNRCHQAGIPVFPSFNRAARAMSRFIQYYERKQ